MIDIFSRTARYDYVMFCFISIISYVCLNSNAARPTSNQYGLLPVNQGLARTDLRNFQVAIMESGLWVHSRASRKACSQNLTNGFIVLLYFWTRPIISIADIAQIDLFKCLAKDCSFCLCSIRALAIAIAM